MALTVKIRGVPVRDDAPVWSVDNIFWWDMLALRKHYPGREILDSTMYLDYVVVLTPAEALEWNRRFGDSYRLTHKPVEQTWPDAPGELTRRLESTHEACRWIIVEQYEWESGL